MANQTVTVWSGFVHQGMVALLVALAKIEEIELQGNTLDDYVLQLEGIEDFSFLHGGKTIEVHQVKAWADKSEEKDYSKALEKLESYAGTFDRFLHTAEEITDWQNYSGPVRRYSYPDGSSFFGKKLPGLHESILASTFWAKLGIDPKRAYFALNQSLAERVCDAHLKVGPEGNFEAKIGLADLKNWTLQFLNDLDYSLGEIWEAMWQGFHEFVSDGEFGDAEDKIIEMEQFVLRLSKLERRELHRFLQNISPHRSLGSNTLRKFDLFDRTGWKDAFLAILFEVKKYSIEMSRRNVPFFFHKNDWWVPTMISDKPKFSVTQLIKENIQGNFIVYFEATVLITERLEELPGPFEDEILDFPMEAGIKEEMDKVGKSSESILKGRLSRIVTIETARNNLNS